VPRRRTLRLRKTPVIARNTFIIARLIIATVFESVPCVLVQWNFRVLCSTSICRWCLDDLLRNLQLKPLAIFGYDDPNEDLAFGEEERKILRESVSFPTRCGHLTKEESLKIGSGSS
jgi:hypothetical protein